jgi:hypothetical protein
VTDPELLSADPETKKWIEAEAARRGMTVPKYLRWMRDRSSGAVIAPWSEPTEHLPSSMPGMGSDVSLDALLNNAFKMKLLDTMGMGQNRGITSDDLVKFAETLRDEKGRRSGESEDVWDRLERRLAKKAELKQLQGMAGDDDAMKKLIEQQQVKNDAEIKALNERLAASDEHHREELAAKDKELADERQAQKEAEQQRRIDEINARLDASHEDLVARLDAMKQGAGGPPVPATQQIQEQLAQFKGLVGGIEGIRQEFQKLNPPPAAPGQGSSTWDKASFLLQQVAEAGSQLMEGAGAIVAARSGGVPPSQLGRMPGPGADDTLYVPDYASGPPSVPPGYAPAEPPTPPPSRAPATPAEAADEQLFPRDRMYIDPEGNKVVPRETFIAKYGDSIRKNPSLARQVPVQQGPAGAPPRAPEAPPAGPGPSAPRDVEPNEGRPDPHEREARDATEPVRRVSPMSMA